MKKVSFGANIRMPAGPAQSRVVDIDRIRELGGSPKIFERIPLPAKLFPNLGKSSAGELPNELYILYEERYAITIYRANENLRAIADPSPAATGSVNSP